MALEEKVVQSILGTNKKQQILHWLKCVRVYVGIYMRTYIYYIHTYQQTHKDFKCSFLWDEDRSATLKHSTTLYTNPI